MGLPHRALPAYSSSGVSQSHISQQRRRLRLRHGRESRAYTPRRSWLPQLWALALNLICCKMSTLPGGYSGRGISELGRRWTIISSPCGAFQKLLYQGPTKPTQFYFPNLLMEWGTSKSGGSSLQKSQKLWKRLKSWHAVLRKVASLSEVDLMIG